MPIGRSCSVKPPGHVFLVSAATPAVGAVVFVAARRGVAALWLLERIGFAPLALLAGCGARFSTIAKRRRAGVAMTCIAPKADKAVTLTPA